ncbi:hypothetical protein FJZ31_37570 [Candidatus Poribacteria bacterium]|nr:hypothetical protein [Candidatus Poribacteria bacterium]
MKFYIAKQIIACVSVAIIFMGCASIFIPQKKWSENLAFVANGGRCNHREMNDGKLETAAKIGLELFPTGFRTNVIKGVNSVSVIPEATDAILTIPNPMQIDRMVIYTPDLCTFKVYSSQYTGQHNWNLFAKVENNRDSKVVIDKSAFADTFLIKVREVAVGNPPVGQQQGKKISAGYRHSAPGIRLWGTIAEIELYTKEKR